MKCPPEHHGQGRAEGDIAETGERAERPEPAGFRDVFAVREFRALWTAQLVSVAGDQLARVALTVLVYDRTRSALLAAVTFVASVVPAFLGGVALTGLADRFSRRRVMIGADLVRCALVLVMALPGMPIAVLVALLAIVTLASAPFTAARAAIYPDVLSGELYVTGTAVTLVTNQFAQIVGFAAGGAAVALLGIRTSLAVDAATFAVSAVIVGAWVRRLPPSPAPEAPAPEAPAPRVAAPEAPAPRVAASGVAASGERDGGFAAAARAVFRNPWLRLPMFFGWLAAFYNAPEGVAAPLAGSLGGGAGTVGIILAAQVLGEAAGMLVFSRLVRPAARLRWMGPLAVAACGVLVLVAVAPELAVVLAVLAASGAFGAYQIAANAAFVAAVPAARRGRSFGLAQGGMSLSQGTLMILAGAAAQQFAPVIVVAIAGGAGAVCAAVIAADWARLLKAAASSG
jgi:Major Facilitator Superfamily